MREKQPARNLAQARPDRQVSGQCRQDERRPEALKKRELQETALDNQDELGEE